MFVFNFNDDYYLNTVHDFTNDLNELKNALDRGDSRGSTALYDAIIGSLDHLKKSQKGRKVLLEVSDGLDNARRTSPLLYRLVSSATALWRQREA